MSESHKIPLYVFNALIQSAPEWSPLEGLVVVFGERLADQVSALEEPEPGQFVRGERANFTRLVIGCIEAKLCK